MSQSYKMLDILIAHEIGLLTLVPGIAHPSFVTMSD